MGKLYVHIQKNQTGHCKKKLKMVQINHVKHEMMDYLKENIGNTLKDNGSGHEFLNMTSFIHNLKPTVGKLNLIKLKCFCVAKPSIQ